MNLHFNKTRRNASGLKSAQNIRCLSCILTFRDKSPVATRVHPLRLCRPCSRLRTFPASNDRRHKPLQFPRQPSLPLSPCSDTSSKYQIQCNWFSLQQDAACHLVKRRTAKTLLTRREVCSVHIGRFIFRARLLFLGGRGGICGIILDVAPLASLSQFSGPCPGRLYVQLDPAVLCGAHCIHTRSLNGSALREFGVRVRRCTEWT